MATSGIEVTAADDPMGNNGVEQLTEAEKELVREELKKTENEINTLRQLLAARQKHVANLKRKLGISPLSEITSEVTQGLKTIAETPVMQKTSEVVAETAETISHKWSDMRNSQLFKSFESKIGTAYTSAKMAASTSIDQLATAARGGPNGGNNNGNSPSGGDGKPNEGSNASSNPGNSGASVGLA